jgi:DNA-3-methyladenine glycosylase II
LAKVGVSPQKIRYLKDLSSRVVSGEVDPDSLGHLPDDRIVDELDRVKGIGPWTAHMLLIFTLGRPDVLPVDDFGIRTAIKQLYSLRKLPKPKKVEALAKNWHPFCSIASLYLWRSKET